MERNEEIESRRNLIKFEQSEYKFLREKNLIFLFIDSTKNEVLCQKLKWIL